MPKMTYKDAGVDIDAGEDLVDWIKGLSSANPQQANVLGGIGGFASLFKLPLGSYEEPCLVSATDGVGTKIKLAIDLEKYDTIGQDLVAMCVNDLICTGAIPLFFLDYYSTGRLELPKAKAFIKGVKEACDLAQCALVGGETAEMPDLYSDGDFDCAGFAVGIVDRAKTIGAHRVQKGNQIVAIESSGFHSNGYSLLRKIFAEDDRATKEKLLEPTRIYVEAYKVIADRVLAMSHVTGGGIRNLLRVIPDGCGVSLREWPLAELFSQAQKRAELERSELFETFNCGVGMYAVFPAECSIDHVIEELGQLGYHSWLCGEVVEGNKEIIWES